MPTSPSFTLEEYYDIFYKFILIAQAYSEIPELSFIIKSCRFRSNIILTSESRITAHKKWIDDWGNSINLSKNKIKVIFNDLLINKENLFSTDLYSGLDLERVIKISTLAFIGLGRDDDLNKNCCLLSFFGIDRFFRTFLLLYDEWKKVAPILIGVHNLRKIYENLDLKNYIQIKNKENILPCVEGKSWLSCLPASEEFIKLVESESGFNLTILGKKHGS
jgi:hypothetical protein